MALMCGGGGGGGEVELTEEEKKMDAELKKAQKEQEAVEQKVIKMLLLGAGESGKSTIFKQMKVINKNGYTDKEKKEFIGIVHSNTIQSMKSMIAAKDKLGIEWSSAAQAAVDEFQSCGCDTAGHAMCDKLDPTIGAIIKKLWETDTIKELFKRRSEYQLNDSAEYYFENIDRCAAADFLPTTDDILRSRVRTTGIVQSDFKIKNLNFSMFDVGGQRNERRKWIHCFDNVQAVVFVASLSEFDQKLYEDETKNRLDEALELFGQIVNSKWFIQTALILFLNKKDLFQKKLEEKKFADYVPDYEGPNDFKQCSQYCKEEMLKRNKNKDKSIYTHITTAIDTSNVKFVFNAVVAMILEQNLKASGIA